MREIEGVTALIYDQTCAAEKRRRRKRGTLPDPDKRVFINEAVCEGCGDCGVKSNCVAILPLETELGRKRQIDQSACNKDFSCLKGFCPSFVTVHGAKPRKAASIDDGRRRCGDAGLPEPALPALDRPYSILVTGIGGTGVVTVSAVLGEAAYLDGKGFGGIDMTGLAQKGGAVACHVRIARTPDEIHAIRVPLGAADVIIGGDLLVTGSTKVLETIRPGHTRIISNAHEMHHRRFHAQPRVQPAERAHQEAARGTRGQSAGDLPRCQRSGGSPVRRQHRRQHAAFGDGLSAGRGAGHGRGDRAGDCAQRRSRRHEPERIPARPLAGA